MEGIERLKWSGELEVSEPKGRSVMDLLASHYAGHDCFPRKGPKNSRRAVEIRLLYASIFRIKTRFDSFSAQWNDWTLEKVVIPSGPKTFSRATKNLEVQKMRKNSRKLSSLEMKIFGIFESFLQPNIVVLILILGAIHKVLLFIWVWSRHVLWYIFCQSEVNVKSNMYIYQFGPQFRVDPITV